MMGVYKSTNHLKKLHPDHKYFNLQSASGGPWMVFWGCPGELTDQWQVLDMRSTEKEANELVDKLQNSKENVEVDTIMIFQTDNPIRQYMNGRKVIVMEIMGGNIRIRLLSDPPSISQWCYNSELVKAPLQKVEEMLYFQSFSS